MSDVRTIRVFIASPGDLAVERAAFQQVLEELNAGFGDALDIKFEPLGWEDTLASTGRRSQEVINREIDRCDVFILAMHRRWGQAAPDAQPYSSYTEEEFHRAFARWQQKRRGKPQAPEIFVFFKHIDSASMADAGPQLQKVLDFRKSLEESRQVLSHGFANEAEFKAEVDRHLRAFAKGELPPANAPRDKVLLPLAVLAEVQKEKAEKEQALARAEREHQVAEAAIARAEKLALEFAERASKAAREGRVEEARQDFAKATDGTANMQVLHLAAQFYKRTGDLATAEELCERSLAINGRDIDSLESASALRLLGLINLNRGLLDRAERTHLSALAIEERLEHDEGVAANYSNLGLIYQAQGEIDRAEEMHRKSLAIEEKLGRQEGMAADYCNLGLIHKARGEQNLAEAMYRKSLAIAEKLGNQEVAAIQYGNLGELFQERGELDLAEEMLRTAFDIHERLGRLVGMANQLAILGLVAKARGEVERSRMQWTKARDLYAKIGMPHKVKEMQGYLDELPKPSAKPKRASGGRGNGQRKRRKS